MIPRDSIEAETAVLGAAMLVPGVLPAAIPVVAPAHFYLVDHQKVYAAMVAIYRDGGFADDAPIDAVILCERLRLDGADDVADNVDLFVRLSRAVPSLGNAVHCARVVRQKAVQRVLNQRAGDTTDSARLHASVRKGE
jgi:replicative DNA helicase